MIESFAVVSATDGMTVSLRISLLDRGGSGIQSVIVLDRFGAPLFGRSFECPPDAVAEVDRVPLGSFPISILATECSGEVTTGEPLDLRPAGATGPGIPVPCSATLCLPNPACDSAQALVVERRNELIENCERLAGWRARRDELGRLLLGLLFLLAALVAAAAAVAGVPIFGQIVAAVLIVAAAAVFGMIPSASYFFADANKQVAAGEQIVDELRRRFSSAAAAAARDCCRFCLWADLSMPRCP